MAVARTRVRIRTRNRRRARSYQSRAEDPGGTTRRLYRLILRLPASDASGEATRLSLPLLDKPGDRNVIRLAPPGRENIMFEHLDVKNPGSST